MVKREKKREDLGEKRGTFQMLEGMEEMLSGKNKKNRSELEMTTSAKRVKKETERRIPGTVLGVNNRLMEVRINHSASDYIVDNYDQLTRDVLAMKNNAGKSIDRDKASDLVNEVYLRIREKEDNGEGFSSDKGKTGSVITIKQYVYGMLKGYSWAYMDDRNELPASWDGREERRSAEQVIFNNAPAFSDIEIVNDRCSILQEIGVLMEYESQMSLNLKYMLKNIVSIAPLMSSGKVHKDLFSEIKTVSAASPEFLDSFRSVVRFALSYPDQYEIAVAGLEV